MMKNRNYIKEQIDIANDRIEVVEGVVIGMGIGLLATIIGCITLLII